MWAAAPSSAQEAAESPVAGATLRFAGMTFTASRDEQNELVLQAEKVLIPPDGEVADLDGVHVVMNDPRGRKSFEMTCARADLQMDSADFRAEGDVEGITGDGRRIYTPWLIWDNATGEVSTEAKVRIVDGQHTLHGRGFRYNVRDGRFVLRGGASVVQE